VNAASPNERLAQALVAFLRQEFGSSVAAILGFIDILLEDARGNDLEDLVPDLNRMQAAGLQLSAMIARILDMSGHLGAGEDGDAYRSRLRHDLRTPLSAIKGYGELLVEEAHESGRDTLVADLTKVLDLTQRLLGEIDKLVEFTGERKDRIAASPIEIVGKVLHGITPLRAAAATDKRSVSSRILVVDDNASNLDLLSRRLMRDDHQVTTAASGAAALALSASESFDLVLLDLMMPEMSGYEVLSRLKADERTRHIPVIMVSALDELDSTVRCVEAGAEDYLPKPFDPVLLRARINASLEKKQLRDREQAIAAELRAEKELSEALLLNILPRTIIDRMRRGETVIADRVAEATILFSDLVDFTSLAANRAPEDTVALLGEVFSRFDSIAAAHGLEKIKTIGDGYMVAGGVPEERADHAVTIAEMALEMLDSIEAASRDLGENLQLRIGMDTGAIVAGVIGTHKFLYDVWGDTVNTSKRMETYGLPGRIHVSAATRRALGDKFRFESRGAMEVKGKGSMETFFLDRGR
jgi:class 3 adenylate cyclase